MAAITAAAPMMEAPTDGGRRAPAAVLVRSLASTALAALLLAAALTGCGDDEHGPPEKKYSLVDFCEATNDNDSADESAGEVAAALNEHGERMAAVEPPADIPADAREGFEVLRDALLSATAETVESDGANGTYLGLSAEDDAKISVFYDWKYPTCDAATALNYTPS